MYMSCLDISEVSFFIHFIKKCFRRLRALPPRQRKTLRNVSFCFCYFFCATYNIFLNKPSGS